MSFLYLDIETLGTTDPAIIAEIASGITPPKTMTKPETIAAWEAETKPLIVADAVAKTSFNGALGSICVIGWAWDDEPARSISVEKQSEGWMLRSWVNMVVKGGDYGGKTVVGHNVAFDIRFLWQRAFVLGVEMPRWFPRETKPWSRDLFCTMHRWGGDRDYTDLDSLCKALGIPGKDDFDGSMVADAWAAGEVEKVASYCRADVERVRLIHRKMQIAYGEEA
jgi:hypothetical protein